ncbi:MAG: hypothetical protein ACTSW5_03965 [Promethearchaeota archaeon]
MKKNSLKLYTILISIIIFFGNLNYVLADTQGWNVSKGDILIYDILELNQGSIIESGSFNVSILDINNTGALFYDLNAKISIDEKNYTTNLTSTNEVETSERLTILSDIDLLFSKSQTKIMIENENDDYLKLDQYYLNLCSGEPNVRYTLKKLTYGYELKLEDDNQAINLYIKMQRDHLGILKHYEIASLNSKGLETSIKITFNSFGGKTGSSIVGFNVGLLLILSLSTIIGLTYKRRS